MHFLIFFVQELFFYCWDKFDYLGYIVYLSCLWWVEGGFRGTPKGNLWLKFFIFLMSWRWFPWHPINLEVFFSDILATTSRLNSLYGLATFVQSSRHVWIMKKVLRHTQHFLGIYDVIYVGFVSHFAVFGYSKCHKVCTNSWFSHGIYTLIGSTTVPSLMCNSICVVALGRCIGRKSAIFSIRPI